MTSEHNPGDTDESTWFESRVDPELRELLALLPGDLFDTTDLDRTRATLDLFAQAAVLPPDREDVSVSNVPVPSRDGSLLAARIYRPRPVADTSLRPALVWIHGGGLIMGTASMNDPYCADVAISTGAVVVSIEYRLAPEHPYPTPIDDCEDVATWVWAEAEGLGIDRSRIAIGGSSAGGGLAAALTHRLYTHPTPVVAADPPVLQLLVYPMLDDRMVTTSSRAITDGRVWNAETNEFAWRAYLGEAFRSDDTPGDAAPARFSVEDLRGLPPAFIPVGDIDLFVDECVEFATCLRHADVPVDLHVFPGLFHGSNLLAPTAAVSRQWQADEIRALRRAFAPPSELPPS